MYADLAPGSTLRSEHGKGPSRQISRRPVLSVLTFSVLTTAERRQKAWFVGQKVGCFLGLQAACKTAASFWTLCGQQRPGAKSTGSLVGCGADAGGQQMGISTCTSTQMRPKEASSSAHRFVEASTSCQQQMSTANRFGARRLRGGFEVTTRLSVSRIINKNVSSCSLSPNA